jgi:SAM-dependent methyltransferase
MRAWTVVDAGCGGGDVAFDLAARVGPNGRVLGLDLDEKQLSIVSAEAVEHGLSNIFLQVADVQRLWPVDSAHMVYARFVLTHLPDVPLALTHALGALEHGGILVVEDVDMAGHFCDPPSEAFERYLNYYLRAAKLRGGDPFIGLKLDLLLERAGFTSIETALVQPFGRTGDVKLIPELTMAAMGDGLLSAGLASRDDVDEIVSELKAFRQRSDTLLFMPRVFQVCGRRP